MANKNNVSTKESKTFKPKTFKLYGPVLEKAMKPKSLVDVRGLHFIINYFDIIISKFIEDLEKRFSKDELYKLKDLGTFEYYFDKANPELSAKKFIKFEIARTSFENNIQTDIVIEDLKGNKYNYETLVDNLSEDDALALLILLVNAHKKN